MLLNGKALNVVVLNGAGNANYSKALTASTTSTTTFGSFQFGKLISYASTSAASIVKSVSKIITYAGTSSTSLIKAVNKLVTTTAAVSTATIARAITRVLSLIFTSTSSSFIVKQINKLITATETTVTSLIKVVNKLVTLLETTVSNIVKQVRTTKSIVSTSLATIVKALSKAITATSTNATTLVKSVGKIVSATSTSSLSIVKAVSKIIVTSIEYVLVTLTKFINRLLTISYSTTVATSITKAVNKLISAAQATVATLVSGRQYFRILVASLSSTVSLSRSFIKIITYVSITTSSLIKKVNKTLFKAVVSIASLLAQYVPLFGAVFRDTFYAPVKKRLVSLTHDNLVIVNNLKNRLVSLVKSRSVNKTEDLNG